MNPNDIITAIIADASAHAAKRGYDAAATEAYICGSLGIELRRALEALAKTKGPIAEDHFATLASGYSITPSKS